MPAGDEDKPERLTSPVTTVEYAGREPGPLPSPAPPTIRRLEHEMIMSADPAHQANLLKAIEFASRKHSRQRRKDADASPYINHPIRVTYLLADTGGITDLVTLMAAVLHDTIEDTETTAQELEAQFGRTVRKVVEELTDDKSLDKAVRKQLQIEHAPRLSQRAKAIKLADKIANVQDVTEARPADWDLARRLDYLNWTEKVVAGCRGTNAALEKCFDLAVKRGRAKFTAAPD